MFRTFNDDIQNKTTAVKKSAEKVGQNINIRKTTTEIDQPSTIEGQTTTGGGRRIHISGVESNQRRWYQ